MNWVYSLAVIAVALGVSLGLTPLSVALARRFGVLDLPGVRKVHRNPTPRLGGVAVALATLVVAGVALALPSAGLDVSYALGRKLVVLGAAGVFLLAVGVVDDVVGVRSKIKLGALVLAGLMACAAGVRVDAILLRDQEPYDLGWIGWFVTLAWIVGVTVSLNFIDGLDGLAGGIGVVACAALAAGSAFAGFAPGVVVALALMGGLLGFLVFNVEPAKVFMGDGGSMFVGFALSSLAVLHHPLAGTTAGLLLPALALSVPLMDAVLTVVRRAIIHRSLFAAEREHIHHRLLAINLCPKHAVAVLHGASAVAAGVGLLLLWGRNWASAIGLAVLAVGLVALFRSAGSTRIRETIAAVRRNRQIGRRIRGYHQSFEELSPRFREVKDFCGWWEAVCAAAEALDFTAVALPLTSRDGSGRVMRWARDDGRFVDAETLSFEVPVKQRRQGAALRASIEVAAPGHLEVATQRVTLFARLVGDHGLTTLPDQARRVRSLGPKSSDAATNGRNLVSSAARGGAEGAHASHRYAVADLAGEAARAAAADAKDKAPRVAVVHDFLYCYAGAERVLEQILEVYPEADVFALFDFLPPGQRAFLKDKSVKTTFIQRLPLASKKHRLFLPLMPLAIEQLDVSEYDVVISSSYLAAKGVITRPDQLHACYCHTPVRFAWDLQNQYLGRGGLLAGLKSFVPRLILHYIRNWDVRSANSVDSFMTNSDYVGRRIRKFYRRSSTTVYPPVDTDAFALHEAKEDFYLTASRLVPYKRVELIVEAFNRMPDRRLIVVGDGPEFDKIKAVAGPNVKLVGHQSFDQLRQYMQLARAFVFAAEEDFGIVPVEAQACGTPVIAFGRGGVTESVVDGVTGVFFGTQTALSIVEAVGRFEERGDWDSRAIRAHAEQFSRARFRRQFGEFVAERWAQFLDARTGDDATPELGLTPAAALGLAAKPDGRHAQAFANSADVDAPTPLGLRPGEAEATPAWAAVVSA